MGMSLVTGIALPESLLLPVSGVSREVALECPTELGENDDPDCLESRPPAIASSCSFILNEGIECWDAPRTGLRRKESLERLEWSSLCVPGDSAGGIGGRALLGAAGTASAIALPLPSSKIWRVVLAISRVAELGGAEERRNANKRRGNRGQKRAL